MYFEYYLYTYFCFSVVILPCALANINPWFNSKHGKTNSREKSRRITPVKMHGVLFFSISQYIHEQFITKSRGLMAP